VGRDLGKLYLSSKEPAPEMGRRRQHIKLKPGREKNHDKLFGMLGQNTRVATRERERTVVRNLNGARRWRK